LPNYINFKNKCLSECPEGYVNNQENSCLKCSIKNCDLCSYENKKLICAKCKEDYLIQEGKCKTDCSV